MNPRRWEALGTFTEATHHRDDKKNKQTRLLVYSTVGNESKEEGLARWGRHGE